jgi:hypothetical protein
MHCVYRHRHRVTLPLEFVDDCIQPLYYVYVWFAPGVSIRQFVHFSEFEFFRVCCLHLCVGHTVENTGVYFIKSMPLPRPHRDPGLVTRGSKEWEREGGREGGRGGGGGGVGGREGGREGREREDVEVVEE